MDSPHPLPACLGLRRASQFPSFSFDTRRLYQPRRAHPLHAPAASGTVIGFVIFGSLAALDFVSRGQIEFAYATAHVFAHPGASHRTVTRRHAWGATWQTGHSMVNSF